VFAKDWGKREWGMGIFVSFGDDENALELDDCFSFTTL
jgi:hypothetical protein